MKCFTLDLPKISKYQPTLTCYIPSNFESIDINRKRPAVLICPGGGYGHCSDREAEPIALQYVAADMAAFVLRYSVAENAGFPTCVLEALTAIKIIRENAEEWDVNPDRIAVCGFSAGGHLAASVGAFWNADFAKKAFGDIELCKPNAAILCYPVITSGPWAHRGSFNRLVGEDASQEQLDLVSLEKQVTESYPPTFLWHTVQDAAVPVMNSIMMAEALAEKAIPFELHIYPTGPHGLSLSDERTAKNYKPAHLEKRPRAWMADSILFLKETVFTEN